MILKSKNNWLFFKQRKICSLCSTADIWQSGVCRGCYHDLPWLKQCCEQCALPLETPVSFSTLCAECFKRPPPFDRIVAALEYRFPIDQLIQSAKFRQQSQHLELLARLLVPRLVEQYSECGWPDSLIPVPMDRFRLLQRQFNHSALLAQKIAADLQLDYDSGLLIKPDKTEHQSGLNRQQRQRNLRNSFLCTAKSPAYVAVVDDVVTTGATAIEIARTLKRAGAKRVDIWSVARTGKGGYL